MADKKISQLTGAVTPLAGTEVLPLVQSGATLKVTAENIFTTTQPSGNANGIVYLNGSKQATTSTSFFYNGSNLGINTSTVTAIFGKTIQIGDGSVNNTIYMVGSGGGSGFLANVGTVFNLTGRGTTTLAFGTNDADRVTIDLSGNTTLLMGNLVIGTAGKGIDFSANTHAAGMTSELLNWYEEGAWTPSVGGDATYTIQEGYYVRVGDLVYVQCQLLLNVLGTGSTTTISGLPFQAFSPSNSSRGTGSVWYCGNLATGVTTLTPGVTPGGQTITFGGFTVLGAGTTMTVPLTIFQNGTRVDFSLVYRAN